jgi:DNA-binding winged helix-turn-helix (wHTH) protein/tetratricopeptide (TPR) repeat protein
VLWQVPMAGGMRVYAFGSFRVDPARRSILRAGAPVRVTAKVFDLLLALIQNRDRVVTRDELMSQLWPDTIVEDGNLSVNVSALRKALDDTRLAAPVIETLPRIGYRFAAETSEESPAETAAIAADGVSDAGSLQAGTGKRTMPTGVATPFAPFVGRHEQMQRLHALFQLGPAASGKLVLIHGEPGIGKTTLAEHFIQSVTAGAPNVRVMVGRCLQQHGAGEAYLPFVTAFAGVLSAPGGEPLRRLFAERAPSWCRYLPAIFEARDAATAGAHLIASGPQLLREAQDVIGAFARETPLIVLLEDLHWADPSSVDLLRLLSQGSLGQSGCGARDSTSWLVLGTFRAAEVWAAEAHPLAGLVRELRMHERCIELALDVLGRESVARYLHGRFGEHDFPRELIELLLQKTRGHPLLFTRLLEWLVDREEIVWDGLRFQLARPLTELELEVPQSVESLILRKLDLLTVAEQRAITHASIEGEDFTSTVVAELLGVDEIELDEQLARLARVHRWFELVQEESWPSGTRASRYRFTHALYRDYLHAQIVPKRRRQLHQRAALSLIAHHRERAAEIAARLAAHFDESGDSARAVEYHTLAGLKAGRAFANREAVVHFSQALRAAERLPHEEETRHRLVLLQERGWRRSDLGENQLALDDFAQMRALAEQLNDDTARWNALTAQAWTYHKLYDREAYREPREALLRQAEESGDARLQAEARIHLSAMYLDFDDDLVRAREQNEQSMALARGLDHERADVPGLQVAGALDYMQARYESCIGNYSRLIERCTRAVHVGRDQRIISRYEQGLAELNLGRLSGALATLEGARALAEQIALQSIFGTIATCIAGVHLELGNLPTAQRMAREVLAMPSEQAHDYARLHAGLDLTLCYLRAPEPDLSAAADAFADARRFSQARECRCSRFMGKARLLAVHGELHLALGELNSAAERARELLLLAVPQQAQKHVALAHWLLAQGHLAQGAHSKARSELILAVQALTDTPSPRLAWRLWADRGRAELALGETAQAAAAFAQACAGIAAVENGIVQRDLRASFSSSPGVRRARQLAARCAVPGLSL